VAADDKREIDEIGLTPEMIEAGVAELADYDPREDDASEYVALVFRAMIARSLTSRPRQS
jgi:hypothetical protein